MSKAGRYITKRKRSERYQLRLPVPKDVQAAFGRKVVTQSLGTSDFDEADERAAIIRGKLLGEWRELRNVSKATGVFDKPVPPTEADLLSLTMDVFNQASEVAGQLRSAAYARDPQAYHELRERQERAQVGFVREIASGNFSRWEETADRQLSKRGFSVDREADWFKRAAGMIAEATVAAIDVENRRERGELGAKPSSAVLERAKSHVEAQAGESNDVPFSELARTFMRMWNAERPSKRDTNTEQQKRATFKLFGEFWDDKPIRGVRHEDAAEFRDKLKLLHPDWARSPDARSLHWNELQAKFGNQPKGLSDSTMNRHMGAIQGLWEWARKRGHCGGENPFDGFHKKIREGENSHSYRAWENDELEQLFSPPPKRSDVLEVMIVGMFTGMRLDEIASLTWGRVRTAGSGEKAITYFDIADAKTPAGVRQVPVHPALAWLLRRDRGAPDARLWPKFNMEGVGKKPGADAGKEFSRFKLARGFTDRRKAFHSFRKNVTRIMERAGVPENEWAQVLGHERGFTYSVYNPDGITLARKAEIIALIDYPGLAIPHPSTP